ncbi:hypothetical protein LTS08_002085 [Lithohypha guttulata]|nr:hypothetical protein LTS08_002085 [Lithohypha guttulata]
MSFDTMTTFSPREQVFVNKIVICLIYLPCQPHNRRLIRDPSPRLTQNTQQGQCTAQCIHRLEGRKSRSHSGKQSRTGSRSTTREHEILPSEHPAKTVDTLTNAIKQGLRPNNSLHSPSVAKASTEKSNLRMPFQDGPSSPTSVYIDVTGAQMQQSAPPPSYEDHIPCESKTFTITKHNTDQYEKEYERSDFTHDLPTPSSHMSAHPIVGADNLGMNSRIPVEKRPPKLDINAVREAEKRGSMTSLSDLIRRATRLASNLDRGRTASSLGHLNMFGSTDQLPTTRILWQHFHLLQIV